ncbi:MAG: hypothetical protein AAGD96_01755 [Chloroflexota bacterium]
MEVGMHCDQLNEQKLRLSAPMEFIWVAFAILSVFPIYGLVQIWIDLEQSDFEGKLFLSSLLLLVLIWLNRSLFHPSITSGFDKSENKLEIERKWVWKTELQNYDLESIEEVLVTQKGNFGKARSYFRIELKLENDQIIRLSSANYRPEENVRREAKKIQTFLGMPVKDEIEIFYENILLS